VICRYRVREDRERDFRELLNGHWGLLHGLGLVTDDPPQQFRGADPLDGGPLYFEIFTWRNPRAVNHAHENFEVNAIWERMRACMVERDGNPVWEFPHVRPL